MKEDNVRVHMFLHCNGGKWSAPADAGSLRTRHRLTTVEQELDVECSASAADMGTLLRGKRGLQVQRDAGRHAHFEASFWRSNAPGPHCPFSNSCAKPFSDHRPPSTPPTQPRP